MTVAFHSESEVVLMHIIPHFRERRCLFVRI
ncbi:putative holin-like toxin [Enterococcus hirae]|nr:putative holin-like toxin [Enterococcus hirae]HCE20252.1 hypothetical protein [Enterococcus sp.]MBO1116520.1 putative holin-like toxin [Enterococcus hirae]NBJ42600.1 putative holin-like toxin [Enterococcus hirae]QIV89390.1 putative holin-like toxin [Enterococcus hirae]